MEPDEKPDSDYQRYATEIDLYERDFKPWVTRGKKVLTIYKDSANEGNVRKRFNILWSNVETLRPALYARDPQPVAQRRYRDADPVGRVASDVLERCLEYTVDCHGFGQVMRQSIGDRLLPGRGVAWARYKPTLKPVQTTDDGDAGEELTYEQVIPDYVYWQDFGHNIARTWDEVTMVWRKVYMTRERLVKRFGKEKGNAIPLDYTPKGIKDESTGESLKKACIYELWDRDAGNVVFLSKSHPTIIETKADPLTLTGMFPCPRPMFATLTNDSLVPVPDYALYQTQAREIEDLTARINSLQKALKVSGVYDTAAPELSRLLNEGYENKLIPVDKWAAFAEKGGIDGAVSFLPIKEVAAVLISLYEAREKSKADLYEITGIADIIRGNSQPNETATAQQIKGRFAVLRISDAQQDVQRFARDLLQIMGEIIAEHFSLDTIKAISGVKLLTEEQKQAYTAIMQQHQQVAAAAQQQQQPAPPPPIPPEQLDLMRQPTWEEVHALLSDQVLREFRIDIETDSTIRTDEDADRKERTEFLTAAGGFLQSSVQIAGQVPELKPLLAEMLMFGVRGHRAARSLEAAFEDAMQEMQKPKPPQPNPEMQKIEAEKELKREEMQLDVQAEQQKQQAQHQEELQRQSLEDERAEREHQREMAMQAFEARLDVQTKERIAQIEAATQRQIAAINAARQTDAPQ